MDLKVQYALRTLEGRCVYGGCMSNAIEGQTRCEEHRNLARIYQRRLQPQRTISEYKRRQAIKNGDSTYKSISKICANPQCGKTFFIVKDGDRGKYCSLKCSYTGLVKIGVWNICPACKKVHFRKRDRKHITYCSFKCSRWTPEHATNMLNLLTRIFQHRHCPECGKSFEVLYSGGIPCRKYCSRKCGKAVHNRRPDSHRRNGAGPKIIDPIFICKRDNWICQICFKPVPKELRGTWNDSAPEVDHIIPACKGGTYTPDNLRCTHRKCNRDRNLNTDRV